MNSVLRLPGYGSCEGPELAHGCAPTGERLHGYVETIMEGTVGPDHVPVFPGDCCLLRGRTIRDRLRQCGTLRASTDPYGDEGAGDHSVAGRAWGVTRRQGISWPGGWSP